MKHKLTVKLIYFLFLILPFACNTDSLQYGFNNQVNYDLNALEFLEDIVSQIQHNNSDYYIQCLCDSNKNLILDPLEVPYLNWNYSAADEIYYLTDIDFSSSGQYLDSIPKTIKNVNTLNSIIIKNSNIEYIPDEVFELTNLEILDLSHNQLKHIQENIYDLNNSLRIINLYNNKITSLHPSIFKLENIEFINLNMNFIDSLPEEVCFLSDLNILSINQNSLCNLEQIPSCAINLIHHQTNCYSSSDLYGLKVLIEDNNITNEICNCDYNLNDIIEPIEFGAQIWENMEDSSHLVEAKFENVQYLAKEIFTNFPELRVLDLANNSIEIIPLEISQSINLTDINLSNNNLINIPESIINLKNLKYLNLSNNDSLRYMPQLFQLEELYISHTNLFCQNDTFNYDMANTFEKNITNINGMYMQYCYMEDDINFLNDLANANNYNTNWQNVGDQNWVNGRLYSFKIQDNFITSMIPSSIKNLSELTIFEIKNNSLVEIPNEIELLYNLESLSLSSNQINTLVINFSDLINLRYLDIESNNLEIFPESVCDLNPIEINFKNNKICDNLNEPCPIFDWNEQIYTQRCKNENDINFINELKMQNNLNGEYYTIGNQIWIDINGQDLERLVFFEHIGSSNQNNSISVITNKIENVLFLEDFIIKNHSLIEVPNEIFSLGYLKRVDLSANNLNYIPVDDEDNFSLNYLNLSHNNIYQVDNKIANFKELEEFDISYNNIDSLTYAIGGMNKITKLNLSNNNLNSLPSNIVNLTLLSSLDISSNKFDSIPESWCDELVIDWSDPNQFIIDDNYLCDSSKIASCITVNKLNQECD